MLQRRLRRRAHEGRSGSATCAPPGHQSHEPDALRHVRPVVRATHPSRRVVDHWTPARLRQILLKAVRQPPVFSGSTSTRSRATRVSGLWRTTGDTASILCGLLGSAHTARLCPVRYPLLGKDAVIARAHVFSSVSARTTRSVVAREAVSAASCAPGYMCDVREAIHVQAARHQGVQGMRSTHSR